MIKRIFFNVTSKNKNERKKTTHCLILYFYYKFCFCFFFVSNNNFPSGVQKRRKFLLIHSFCCFLFAINSSFLFYFTTHSTMQNALLKDNTQIIFNKSSFSVPSFKYPFFFFFFFFFGVVVVIFFLFFMISLYVFFSTVFEAARSRKKKKIIIVL